MAQRSYESVSKASRGRVWTEEMRDKLSASRRAANKLKGTALSDEEYQRRKSIKSAKIALRNSVLESGNHVIDQKTDKKGYVWVRVAFHPIHKTRWLRRSHLVLSESIGRKLGFGEVAHHRDKVRNNDSIANLQLLTKAEHDAIHAQERIGKDPWNKGGRQTEEHRRKIGEANKGRVWASESRAKMSKFASNRTDLARDEKGRISSKRSDGNAS